MLGKRKEEERHARDTRHTWIKFKGERIQMTWDITRSTEVSIILPGTCNICIDLEQIDFDVQLLFKANSRTKATEAIVIIQEDLFSMDELIPLLSYHAYPVPMTAAVFPVIVCMAK